MNQLTTPRITNPPPSRSRERWQVPLAAYFLLTATAACASSLIPLCKTVIELNLRDFLVEIGVGAMAGLLFGGFLGCFQAPRKLHIPLGACIGLSVGVMAAITMLIPLDALTTTMVITTVGSLTMFFAALMGRWQR